MKSKLLFIPALFLFACSGGTNVETNVPDVAEALGNVAEAVESAEGLSLKKDARLIGGDKSELQMTIESRMKEMAAATENKLIGHWVGAFGPNKINVSLSKIDNNTVEGFSICAGNYRPLNGEVTDNGDNSFTFALSEPGDDQYDGKFEFTVDLGTEELRGSWTPFKEKGNSSKDYVLAKKSFEYRTDVGKWPQASSRLLTDEDVENLFEDELKLMRNEIYARHGYCFKNKEFRHHFEETEWYMPMGVDIRDQLTDIEVQNIDLIYEYETYYEEYYDDYGR